MATIDLSPFASTVAVTTPVLTLPLVVGRDRILRWGDDSRTTTVIARVWATAYLLSGFVAEVTASASMLQSRVSSETRWVMQTSYFVCVGAFFGGLMLVLWKTPVRTYREDDRSS